MNLIQYIYHQFVNLIIYFLSFSHSNDLFFSEILKLIYLFIDRILAYQSISQIFSVSINFSIMIVEISRLSIGL